MVQDKGPKASSLVKAPSTSALRCVSGLSARTKAHSSLCSSASIPKNSTIDANVATRRSGSLRSAYLYNHHIHMRAAVTIGDGRQNVMVINLRGVHQLGKVLHHKFIAWSSASTLFAGHHQQVSSPVITGIVPSAWRIGL